MLAALGKRDREMAGDGTLVLTGDARPQVRRQAKVVWVKSALAALALTVIAFFI